MYVRTEKSIPSIQSKTLHPLWVNSPSKNKSDRLIPSFSRLSTSIQLRGRVTTVENRRRKKLAGKSLVVAWQFKNLTIQAIRNNQRNINASLREIREYAYKMVRSLFPSKRSTSPMEQKASIEFVRKALGFGSQEKFLSYLSHDHGHGIIVLLRLRA